MAVAGNRIVLDSDQRIIQLDTATCIAQYAATISIQSDGVANDCGVAEGNSNTARRIARDYIHSSSCCAPNRHASLGTGTGQHVDAIEVAQCGCARCVGADIVASYGNLRGFSNPNSKVGSASVDNVSFLSIAHAVAVGTDADGRRAKDINRAALTKQLLSKRSVPNRLPARVMFDASTICVMPTIVLPSRSSPTPSPLVPTMTFFPAPKRLVERPSWYVLARCQGHWYRSGCLECVFRQASWSRRRLGKYDCRRLCLPAAAVPRATWLLPTIRTPKYPRAKSREPLALRPIMLPSTVT